MMHVGTRSKDDVCGYKVKRWCMWVQGQKMMHVGTRSKDGAYGYEVKR